jgi:hypothetical protein
MILFDSMLKTSAVNILQLCHVYSMATRHNNDEKRNVYSSYAIFSGPTGCGPPAWGLGGGLRTHHRKTPIWYETGKRASDQDGFFGKTTPAPKNGKYSIKRANRSFEDVAKFKYLGATLTDQNYTHEEIKSRINSGNACYLSVQTFCPSACCLGT